MNLKNRNLGVLIQKNRSSRKLSLRGYAAICGLNHSYISQLEKGLDNSITVETLEKIAKAMRLSLLDLMVKCGFFDNEGRVENA